METFFQDYCLPLKNVFNIFWHVKTHFLLPTTHSLDKASKWFLNFFLFILPLLRVLINSSRYYHTPLLIYCNLKLWLKEDHLIFIKCQVCLDWLASLDKIQWDKTAAGTRAKMTKMQTNFADSCSSVYVVFCHSNWLISFDCFGVLGFCAKQMFFKIQFFHWYL